MSQEGEEEQQDDVHDKGHCLVYENVMKCKPPPHLATRFGG
jgi:hypothetical protein